MQPLISRVIQTACLLAASPAALAHPALFDGSPVANLIHLLTQPDHLLMMAGIGLAAGILRHLKNRA